MSAAKNNRQENIWKCMEKNLVAEKSSSLGALTFTAINPINHEKLLPQFHKATSAEINESLLLAERAFEKYRKQPAEKIASFLELIGEEILRLGGINYFSERIRKRVYREQRLAGERACARFAFKIFPMTRCPLSCKTKMREISGGWWTLNLRKTICKMCDGCVVTISQIRR